MTKKVCRTRGCDGAIKHPGAGLCGKCYSFMYYWKDRTPTQKMARVSQIEFWNSRAHDLLTPPKVSSITERQKKRA